MSPDQSSDMRLEHIDHFTLRVAAARLPELLDFYTRVLGLREGDRPAFDFPGHWLYAQGQALVHLAGNEPVGEPAAPAALPTGKFNHVSLRATGLKATREHLQAQGLDWREAPVPGAPLHQIFLIDPVGLTIELTFDAAELHEAGPSTKALAY
ncbi:VOC family protein [Hydrogenophaga borbori]|nr:VOC family protein [Hydrogenophaga borbori]